MPADVPLAHPVGRLIPVPVAVQDAEMGSEAHFWVRTASGWHVVFTALLLISIGLASTDGGGSNAARTAAVLVLLGWGVWYLVAGRHAWMKSGRPLGPLYVAGMLPLCVAALSITPATSVMLFAAIPQIYAIVDRLRDAVCLVGLLFLGFGVALFFHGAGPGVFLGVGFSALFSAVMGAWIGGIIRQSQQRADWISQLRDTQGPAGRGEPRTRRSG